MWGIEPDALVGIAGLAFILVLILVSVIRGWFIPASTHKMTLSIVQTNADKDIKIAQDHAEQTRLALTGQLEADRKEMHDRMEAFRADHAVRVDQAREDHDKQLAALAVVTEGVRRDFAAIIAAQTDAAAAVVAGKEREIDYLRGALSIADEAKWQEIAGALDELVAGSRGIGKFINAFQDQTGVPQLGVGEG